MLFAMHAMPISAQNAGNSSMSPVAVIDTTAGRLRCSLFVQERPRTTANFIGLADGTKDWNNPTTGTPMHGQRFYDGTTLRGIPAGIAGGSRAGEGEKAAEPSLEPETKPAMRFDRAGLLAMVVAKGEVSGSRFEIVDHANAELDGPAATIFGECDAESVKVVEAISHRLLAVDNLPAAPIAINRISIVRAGEAMPAVAAEIPAAAVVPVAVRPAAATVAAPEPTGPTAVLETSMGKIKCRMFTKESPIATAAFIGLADGTKSWTNPVTHAVEQGKRFYDGMVFDRVIPDFVIQSGDYTGDPSGSVDIGFRFKNEVAPGLVFDRPGRLAFGNDGPDRNNSEIFITEHPMHRLDGGYTIIGQCDEASVALVEAIARVPRDAGNRPLEPVKILRVVFQPH